MPGKALLIGVPEYESEAIPNLEFVENDIADLSDAFSGIGYGVTTLGGIGKPSPTRGAIINRITEFCRHGVQENELAIIYFSGHGLHHQGKDYLIPTDATLADELIDQLMVPIDFATAFEQSPASTILFFVDACREGVDLGEKSLLSYQQWSRGKRSMVESQQFAYVFACGPGEVSRFVPGLDGFSLFSKALSETISESRSVLGLTFGRLRSEVQKRVDELAGQFQLQTQNIRILSEGGATEDKLTAIRISSGGLRRGSARSVRPETDVEALAGLRINDDDLRLLSRNIEPAGPWIEGTVSIFHVLRCAAVLEKPLIEVLDRLQQFGPVGIEIPDVAPDLARIIEVRREDKVLLPPNGDDGRRSGLRNEVPALHVLYAANRLGKAVDETLDSLRRFEPLGVGLPYLDPAKVKGLMVDERDLIILSRDLDGEPPWQEEVSMIHLLRAAAQLEDTIGAVDRSLKRLEPWDITTTYELDDSAREFKVDKDELRVLSENLNASPPWVPPLIPVGHLLYVANREGTTVGRAAERLYRFYLLGWQLPVLDVSAHSLEVPNDDLVVLSRDFDGIPPWLSGRIPGARLLAASWRFETNLSAICKAIARYDGLGFSHADVDQEVAGEMQADRDDMILLTGDNSGEWADALDDVVPVAHVLFAAHHLGESVDQAAKGLKRLAVAGVTPPEVDWSKVEGLRISHDDLRLLSADLDGQAPWRDLELGWFQILRAAQGLERSVGEVMTQAERFADVGYVLPEGDLETVADVVVSEDDLIALSRDLNGWDPWVGDEPISYIQILRLSNKLEESIGEILERLRPFEGLRITLPSITDPDVLAVEVDEDDLLLLSRDFDGLAPWVESGVPVGNVLSAAANQGTTIRTILDRLLAFGPLGFAAPEIEGRPAEMKVDERDLVLLSRDLDGRPPWVERDTPIVHLLRAAGQLEESVGDTLQRLQRLESVDAMALGSSLSESPWARAPTF